MKVIKGFKLANVVLASALALALSGCADDPVNPNPAPPPADTASNGDTGSNSDTGSNGDTGGTTTPFSAEKFVLISSAGTPSDIQFTDTTVGDWSTGSIAYGAATYEGLDAWSVTSGEKTAEQGNWGTVLVFQDGISGDFSLFNRLKLKFATSGGYEQYKVAVSANGISKEIILPVDDTSREWQDISIDLSRFALNLSEIDSLAVMGVGGTPTVSKIYLTDFELVRESEIVVDTVTEPDFIFKLSDSEQSSLVVDNDNTSAEGNVIFGEWETQTVLADSSYNGLSAWELSAGAGWGAVLALSGDISDGTNIDNYDVDFSKYTNIKFKVASEGAFERYALSIVSKSGSYDASQEVGFTLATPAEWNAVDIDLDSYGVDLANINQIAVMGVYADGTAASQKLYLTDFVAYDTGMPSAVKDSSDDKFVFISSSGEQLDLIVDGDNFAHNGNITVGEWSQANTIINDVVYSGLASTELTKSAVEGTWGTVLSMAGDIYGGVLPYDLDLSKYSTVNFKIAAEGTFDSYEMAFVTAVGAEFKLPLTVTADWADVTINLADLPLNLMQLNQIAIYGIGGAAGDKIYITDFNIAK